jgi:hypothetical protein
MRTLLLLALPAALAAQTAPHWGIQGDYFEGAVPKALIDKIKDLPERPDIDAKAYNAGVVRFHANGSPSWALEFSRTQMTLNGGLTIGTVRQELRGTATVRGAMITKYANFYSSRYVSFGLAFGGGAGQVDADYYRYLVPPGPGVILERESTQRVVPVFQALAQVDIRPVRWISLSPFYGVRNGTLGAGGAIRIHFTR